MSGLAKIGIGVAVVLVVGIGAWLGSPLFYDREVNEDLPGGVPVPVGTTESADMVVSDTTGSAGTMMQAQSATPRIVASGQFSGADSFHQASGTAQLVEVDGKTYVRFEEDFTVTNGPDLFVHFGNNGTYDADANLGRLKGNIGSQNYEVPADINPSQFSEVWVWCRAFSVPFGSAELQ